MKRRSFLSLVSAAGTAVAAPKILKAENVDEKSEVEFVSVLTDTTRCIGCRTCEVACAEAHDLEIPDIINDNGLEEIRNTNDKRLTVVNRFDTDAGEVFVKKQCMHCWQPACTAACLTKAMLKTEDGPVIWREDKCMGCRFCMLSCPFEMPKFEYYDWNPEIRKCDMCYDRLEEGKQTACVTACPTDALTFGSKRVLMEVARERIYHHPDKYVHKIYGEHVAGGTGWLYLSPVPFEQIGLREDLGTTPYPEYTKQFLYAVPVIFFGLPSLLLGLNLLANEDEGEE